MVINGYGIYPKDRRTELAQADAYIWYNIARLISNLHKRNASAGTMGYLNDDQYARHLFLATVTMSNALPYIAAIFRFQLKEIANVWSLSGLSRVGL